MTHLNLNKLPISAVVVTCNEAHLIEACLQSLDFCKEIIVIDLESTDDSKWIAGKYATLLLSHPKSLAVEPIRHWIASQASYEWILYIDPDERLDPKLKEEFINKFQIFPANTGMVSVRWQFYFKKHPLKGTFWGIVNMQKTILIHRERVVIPEGVHQGYQLKNSFTTLAIQKGDNKVLHHYWMTDFKKLYEKHKRHLQVEGKTKYEKGWRYNQRKQFKNLLTAFYDSYIIFEGWKDGFIGLYLSLFYAWYNFQIWNSLKKYQKSNESLS